MENAYKYETTEEEQELKALLIQILKAPLDEMSSTHLEKIESAVDSGATKSSRKILASLSDSLNSIKDDISSVSEEVTNIPGYMNESLDRKGAQHFSELNRTLERILDEVNKGINDIENKIQEKEGRITAVISNEIEKISREILSNASDMSSLVHDLESKNKRHFNRLLTIGLVILLGILSKIGIDHFF